MTTLDSLIKPDFQIIWSKEEAEKEMPGFQFKGTGWYRRPEAVMVAFPAETAKDFHFWVFFGRDPRAAFEVFCALPVLMDIEVAKPKRQWHFIIASAVIWVLYLFAFAKWGMIAILPCLTLFAILSMYWGKKS